MCYAVDEPQTVSVENVIFIFGTAAAPEPTGASVADYTPQLPAIESQ